MLRLVAIYGLVMSLSVLVFGAAVGAWIDRNERILSAKTFLIFQNAAVAVSGGLLAAFFWCYLFFFPNSASSNRSFLDQAPG